MKKLFLHIGAGKTGTSAIQSQLVINREILEKYCYYYPISPQDKIAKEFKITSGNSVQLGLLLKELKTNIYSKIVIKNKIKKIFKQYVKDAKGKDIILSSELFESYSEKNGIILKKIANDYGYEVVIIYYIRAIADHFVSSYHQLIKRHNYTKDINSLIDNMPNRFLSIINKSDKTFGKDNIIVKNYDKVKDNIFKDFIINILEIKDIKDINLNSRKINRSLTNFEIKLMKYMNQSFNQSKQSSFISDALIHHNPNKPYKISISKTNLDKLSLKYSEDIIELNSLLSNREKELKLYDSLDIIDSNKEIALNSFQESVLSILSEIVKEIKK